MLHNLVLCSSVVEFCCDRLHSLKEEIMLQKSRPLFWHQTLPETDGNLSIQYRGASFIPSRPGWRENVPLTVADGPGRGTASYAPNIEAVLTYAVLS